MIFTFIGHTFRISLDGFLKFLLWTLGTGYQIKRSAESEYTNGLSNLDFHSRLQPLVTETDHIYEKLH